jgi:GTP pyrophosphokinase
MQKNQLSFAKVTDIYGFRIIVPKTLDCYTALGVLHQKYKPMPGRFKDYIAIAKSNGYQSLHTTLVGPSSVSIEFQIRTEEMNIVAEAGVAAHWLYKAQQGHDSEHLSTQWLQSLLDIQNETRDAAEFWDHVKVDLFPDAVYVFTPKSEIMAMPRGATVVDFAYAIHSKIGHRTTAAKINDEEVPLRTELKSGDVVQIITSETSTPNPAWLSFVKTGRARSKIRSYLKNAAQTEAGQLGETLLAQALRAEGIDSVPSQDDANKGVWDEMLRITGNRTPADLMVDIGMGRRIASLVAARMTSFMTKQGCARMPCSSRRSASTRTTAPSRARSRSTATRAARSITRTAAAPCRATRFWATWAVRAWSCTTPIATMPSSCAKRMPTVSSPWTGPTTSRGCSRPASWSRCRTTRACWPVWRPSYRTPKPISCASR